MTLSPWHLANRADPAARVIADRHYNRQKVGAPQFVPPGRCLVLKMPRALWVTSWPFAEYVKHAWPGAWICSAFRRERRRGHQASTLIRLAVAHTRFYMGEPPALGMITFVNEDKVKAKANPGACFLHAGFTQLMEMVDVADPVTGAVTQESQPVRTKSEGLLVFQMLPADMPAPLPAGDDLFCVAPSVTSP